LFNCDNKTAYETCFLAGLCLSAHLFISAQTAKVKPELVEGIWQVSMQSTGGVFGKLASPE